MFQLNLVGLALLLVGCGDNPIPTPNDYHQGELIAATRYDGGRAPVNYNPYGGDFIRLYAHGFVDSGSGSIYAGNNRELRVTTLSKTALDALVGRLALSVLPTLNTVYGGPDGDAGYGYYQGVYRGKKYETACYAGYDSCPSEVQAATAALAAAMGTGTILSDARITLGVQQISDSTAANIEKNGVSIGPWLFDDIALAGPLASVNPRELKTIDVPIERTKAVRDAIDAQNRQPFKATYFRTHDGTFFVDYAVVIPE